MKLDCEVIAIKSNSETLTVRLQGSGKRDAEWRRMGSHTIEIAETVKTQRLFHIGRRVLIILKAK